MPSTENIVEPAVTFHGAAHTVTGSMHLVEVGGRKILLDCGLVRTPGIAGPHLGTWPVAPHMLDAVILSHAHLDHCGALPALVNEGFAGPIYCTAATRDLVGLMLANSSRIQDGEARVRSIIGTPEAPEARTRFRGSDVQRTVAACVPLAYDQPVTILGDVGLRLTDAGHILGSASIVLTLPSKGREYILVFSGDLGRRGSPLLRDPAPLPPADLLICESTNGDRAFDPLPDAAAALEELVRRTVDRGGKVLLPAFSLGRTQTLVQVLREGIRQGRVPAVPIFVDSPLAAAISDVYRRHSEALRECTIAVLDSPEAPTAAPGPSVHYVVSAEESQDLSTRREPCIVIAPGGMCEGGRIVRHIKLNIDDPRCSVVLVGYQAPHTLGHRLLKPGPAVRIHGRKWNRWADVVEMPGFSGHPDQGELLLLLDAAAGKGSKVRLVHGEPQAAETFAWALRRRGFTDVAIPQPGEHVRLA
jgi:metallo-beta-lactamase family protein